MELEFHQVLLCLYEQNLWLYRIHNLQEIILFEGGRVNSNVLGKIQQTQLLDTLKLRIIFWNTNVPNQL